MSLPLHCNSGCAIEEVDAVTMTGYTVTRFEEDGSSQSLPNLNERRNEHACGHYTTSDNSIVDTKKVFY